MLRREMSRVLHSRVRDYGSALQKEKRAARREHNIAFARYVTAVVEEDRQRKFHDAQRMATESSGDRGGNGGGTSKNAERRMMVLKDRYQVLKERIEEDRRIEQRRLKTEKIESIQSRFRAVAEASQVWTWCSWRREKGLGTVRRWVLQPLDYV